MYNFSSKQKKISFLKQKMFLVFPFFCFRGRNKSTLLRLPEEKNLCRQKFFILIENYFDLMVYPQLLNMRYRIYQTLNSIPSTFWRCTKCCVGLFQRACGKFSCSESKYSGGVMFMPRSVRIKFRIDTVK